MPSALVDVRDGIAERRVFEMGTRPRWWLRLFGALLAFVLPAAMLLTSAIRYDLRCVQAERRCSLGTFRAFVVEERTDFSFDDVSGVVAIAERATRTDEWSGRSELFATGRSWLTINRAGLPSLTASFAIDSDEVPVAALTAHIKDGVGDHFAFRGWLPLRHITSVVILSLFGLFILAWTRFRTVVSLDGVSGVVSVERHDWPLASKTVLRLPAGDIRDVFAPVAEKFFHIVHVEDRRGGKHHVGRYLTSFRADAIRDTLAAFAARGRRGRG